MGTADADGCPCVDLVGDRGLPPDPLAVPPLPVVGAHAAGCQAGGSSRGFCWPVKLSRRLPPLQTGGVASHQSLCKVY